jgi:hypothetical protein
MPFRALFGRELRQGAIFVPLFFECSGISIHTLQCREFRRLSNESNRGIPLGSLQSKSLRARATHSEGS